MLLKNVKSLLGISDIILPSKNNFLKIVQCADTIDVIFYHPGYYLLPRLLFFKTKLFKNIGI